MPLKTTVAGLMVVLSMVAAPSASSGERKMHTADPLVGTWDTAATPLSKYRAALAAHGYPTASIDKLFKNYSALYKIKKTIKYEIRFYRDSGTPFQIVRFWDPTTWPEPPDSRFDHGPYKLLRGNRFASRGTDPPTDTYVTTFSYTVHAKQLILHFVSLVEPGLSEKQRLADQKRSILQATATYRKVGP
jgi:hypothetical protein